MESNSEIRRLIKNSKPQGGGEDRISELPDAILCHILSFVPTKYAARTSILSKRWKDTWASVPNLVFEHKSKSFITEKKHECDSVVFSTFVDRALSLRDSSSDIKKFRLRCSCCSNELALINAWIQTAIERNVVELDLRVDTILDDCRRFELPRCIFTCKTLVALKVSSNCITYAPPASGCFLSLKKLYRRTEYPDNDSMGKIFSCCPVLEDLTIHGYLGQDEVLNFNISVPELKTLRVSFPHMIVEEHDFNYSFFINCPKLENLDLRQDILSNYIFVNAKSLISASINLFLHSVELLQPNFYNRAAALLAGISHVKYLSLSAHLLKRHCVPAFDHLSELKLVINDCYHWDLLTELLTRSPNLESLVVEHDEESECVSEYDEHEYLKDDLYSEHRWSTPESVPACLISHLKTITIKGFKGYPHEKKAAKYLLENAEVLEKMIIHDEVYRDLMLQNDSRKCQVEFI